ncbi:MAG: protein-methionine-sulfoxide reductase heme-binding subunit MsrQ [Pseudomonadota bacterium]
MSKLINKSLRHVPAWLIYAISLGYALWLFWLGFDGQLGPNPVEALEHVYGDTALYLLIAGLAVSPLRDHLRINLMKFRRAIGVTCFFFVLAHLTVWAVLDVQALDRIWADILKRPYITVGMAGFVLLLPLAITSNNWSVRKLGAAWRKLHLLVYPAALLGAFHYVMLAKGWQMKPLVLFVIVAALIALRMPNLLRGMRTRSTSMVRSSGSA